MMKSIQNTGLFLFAAALLLFILLNGLQSYRLFSRSLPIDNEYHHAAILESARRNNALGVTYQSSIVFNRAFRVIFRDAQRILDQRFSDQLAQSRLPEGVQEWDFRLGDWKMKEYALAAAKSASVGPVSRNPWLFFGLTIGLGILGGLLYILPLFREIPGIKNNGVYHSSMTRGITGWLGILAGVFLITFYVLLYWYPQHITAWMIMSDPLSRLISGNEASQWFVYGLLYTVVMLTMGVRMISKYRHNRYQMIRTGSVMFFQTSFAFLIPEILVRLNQPYYDFKNIWPLNYSFFFDWNLNNLLQSGGLGLFMLVWGIALIVVAVPVFTYFFGKRWYCSWVCGCGGLAETLGDPFRQLSDKSLRAWKIERWMVHGVLGFAIVMTAMTLYTYFTGQREVLFLNSDSVRSWYGFLIGSAFAGVVGTGFYPLMGNRVWCRFGCPLAAYLGIVQRFKSRFRITVNGGQCISCGNCSTYCEMGIDVRHYAQRGQDVVRASCVGCGICAAVCPRGVLKLENTGAKRNV